MIRFDQALIITHVYYSKNRKEPTDGPYSSVYKSLKNKIKKIETCQLPIASFENKIVWGRWPRLKKITLPAWLSCCPPIKYLVDYFLITGYALKFILTDRALKKVIIAIDPLSCLPLIPLKKLFSFRLVFYCVDFNRKRSSNRLLQKFYEIADKISSQHSDQTWVISEALKTYKKDHYQIKSFYVPNSPVFDSQYGQKGKLQKKGNKIAWTGGFMTDRQFDLLFGILSKIQKIRPEMEFYFAPIVKHQKFVKFCRDYQLKKSRVLYLKNREECLNFFTRCDLGIAIYDDQFGSTKFIEPLKIWDFMICAMPFIISSEPSISKPIKKAGIAYFLEPGNKIPKDGSFETFLKKENLKKRQKDCLALAQKFDIQKQILKCLQKMEI
ncbi:MAG: hypothetical protein JW991_05650 [Candidatus Pacebacteria bacterium]|nr:hypothetical protein [Candidatus Paceibacterota bacterium]